ncbi:protein translocase subunit SecF [Marinomonas mediterranea]|jgi:protein translocase subunit secF|uniref:Protein-export membrane protein SecF n=1 Tax=Marinomonas mediterranea (strain ATCC 700492 / JCM 21426 / NBRC 103028 / MMB-1) TaxID=717774 RepID=F2JYV4_MARM1|nr:protein translocase subunit SecF [Marinomonas mediterranea]ADZ90819.1 protein-export membrane protein SecF [Marinomonas mediterranea MMB-1]WCN12902.1 protein translocase subunit SecF [Marinomonas mediterranea]WCN16971.1 protein translocase subunit SecF [Marinomonas mediterranea MMB-1]
MKVTNIPFMAMRKIVAMFSVLLILISIGSLATKGLQFGLDFTGGTLVEVKYDEAPNLDDVRAVLAQNNYSDVVVQNFGSPTDVVVRMANSYTATLGDEVLVALKENGKVGVSLQRSEFVGAQVGEELREQGGLGMLLALAIVMLYVAVRFQFKFSIASVAALAHDVVITLGVFSLFEIEFDLTVLAALLAVIGYSLNDTIVVCDRIRENFRIMRETEPEELINESINQTLGRTIITSMTTLFVLVVLFLFGGEAINNFSFALLVGIVIGTYSSIFVAANLLLAQNIKKEDLIPAPKEELEDELP